MFQYDIAKPYWSARSLGRQWSYLYPLEPQAVRYIVWRRAQLAGLTGDFSAHSLRSGFMTEAGRQNVPLAEVMALTGHRSVHTALRYFQTGAVQEARAANLLAGSAKKGPVTAGTRPRTLIRAP
jgi:integrase